MKIKNLYCATVNKLGSAHQAVIKNRLVRRVVKPKLSAAYLELTNNCNLNCKMCIYKKLHGKTGNMSRSLYESCVTQLSEMGLDTLYLHFGGESLLHPEFKDFLKFAVQCRDKGGIRSIAWIDNGMLFNQNIADLVVDLKVDTISFSLDGVGEVNDRIRLGSIYSVIEKNIKYLIKKRGGTKKPQVYLSMCDFGKIRRTRS
jgi:sulfatase maturation enzyme AslB (radical SAM superfamily)